MTKTFTLKTLGTYIALAGTLVGCTKNIDNSDVPSDKSLYITIQMPVESNGVSTRAIGDEVSIVEHAYVVVYAAGAGDSELPKYTTKLNLEDITAGGSAGEKKILAFTPTSNIVEGDHVNIIFNKEIADLSIPKNGLIAALKLSSASGLVELTAGLPMYGSGKWTAAGSPTISIKRAVAKIQLKLDYGSGTHVPGSMGSNFTTDKTTYKLYQLSDVGNINGSDVGFTCSLPITDITNEDEINQASTTKDDNYTGANYIYAYPYSTKSIGSTPSPLNVNDFSPIRLAMIMKNVQNDGKIIYHRLDVYDKASNSYYDILNNYHYTIRVREVNNGGYSTASEALKHPSSNVQFDIIVEEEGTDIVSNGQYVLNVNELSREFTVSGAESTIKIAEVSRQTSVNAVIEGSTSFNVVKEDIFQVGDINVAFTEVPSLLDNSVKSLKISASGEGIATFRYHAKLGNIDYKSAIITVKSEKYSEAMVIDGFVGDLGVPNGYANNTRFVIGKELKFKATSTFKEEWDASLSLELPSVAPAKFTKSTKVASIAENVSDGKDNNGFYFNVYRTAPGDKDIVGSIDITVTLPDNTVYTHLITAKITTSCDLPTEAENYGVKINGLLWADRNVGSALPAVAGYEVSKNYSNDSAHPDYSVAEKSAIVGTAYPILQIGEKCDNLGLGIGRWRMPSAETNINTGEIANANARVRHSKGRVFIVGDAEGPVSKMSGSVVKDATSTVRSKGCFLPLGGANAATTSGYWSSRSAYSLNVSSTSSNVSNGSGASLFSLRCVKEHYDLKPASTVEGFCPSAGRQNMTVKDGYDIHALFGISNTTHTIKSVESSFNRYWDGFVSIRPSESARPNVGYWNSTTSNMSLSVSTTGVNNKVYFHPFRTSPGEADILGVLKVKGMTTWGASFSFELPLTIITSCELPSKADNYSIQINKFRVADRSCGSKMPTGDVNYQYELSQNFTMQASHPDHIEGSRGGDIYTWLPQHEPIAAIAGEYYAWKSTTGMDNAHTACENLKLGIGSWRLPTGHITDKSAESVQMYPQFRYSKYRVFLLSTVSTSATDKEPAKYSGVFLPIAGFSGWIAPEHGMFWTATNESGSYAYRLYWTFSSSTLHQYVHSTGFTARCVADI